MGLLSEGKPLSWEQTKKYADHIRNHGINQFLSIYNKTKNREKDCLLWGDEIEYMLIAYDDENKNAKLSLRASDIFNELQKEVEEMLRKGYIIAIPSGTKYNKFINSIVFYSDVVEALWRPERTAYMIEGVPGIPYGNTLESLLLVEQNMKHRRQIASKYLRSNEGIITLSNFPRFGCTGQFLEPHHELFGPKLRSSFLPDELALTAATPIWRGYLSDMDCRWFALVKGTDDRTKKERGLEPLKNDRFVINKPRFDTIAYYISTDKILKTEYNDKNPVYDQNIYKKLIDNEIDELLAHHVSYLFIRDPLFAFEELLHQDNIHSTNWQSVRFKPPPPNSDIGWRVEFRCMDVQISDFENAAFVDKNMNTAYKRDALNTERFWFRKNIFANCDEDEFEKKMTINDIVNGNGNEFPGLICIIFRYLETMNVGIETRYHLEKYLEFVGMRASGKLQTAATWIRNFVRSHPNYNYDSIVSQEINYDLIKMIEGIQKSQVKTPELL
ncbi:45543_t:CDS:10, partial [Gigaspora margarita]